MELPGSSLNKVNNTCFYFPLRFPFINAVLTSLPKSGMWHANTTARKYNDRLEILELRSLQLHRFHQDLIYVYKIIYGLIDVDCSRFSPSVQM